MWRLARRRVLSLAALVSLVMGAVWLPTAATALGASSRAAPAANLLQNPGAQAGAASARGWDSVTIPGWLIVRGLPTVVRYGTPGFPAVSGSYPARHGGQLFAGGLGGTAVLRQEVQPRTPAGGLLGPGKRYVLSGWLGGTATSQASVHVLFLSASGSVLGSTHIGPVGHVASADGPASGAAAARIPGLAPRAVTGTLPPGTSSARVDLRLATSARGADGPDGPRVGYNWAIADDIRLSVLAPVRPAARLRPPAAHVPRFAHVFLFYFENQDYGSVIGDIRRAPYLNSLLPRASVLANFYAEEHPSDGNYLAIAGGSTFGIPLTDPLESDPLYTIHARNIGDLVDAAHETWKGYLQSADGPCDDTVHRSYWDDDEPLLYFADIRDRPAYCAAHVVPLEQLHADLARTSTTPNFAWIGPNDCSDMEGCGIHAGDVFAERELGAIMRSPAWRTQRSLAIITFDEDAYNDPHPPQRVATIMIGSSAVRRGYVSHVRYTHYSLLRTIEAALGLGTLTANDRYAQPVNDVFDPSIRPDRNPDPPQAPARLHGRAAARPASAAARASSRSQSAGSGQARPAQARPAQARPAQARPADRGPLAFVVSSGSGTVTPIDLRTRRALPAVKVGADPDAIVAAPDGRTLYVANAGSGTVTPINATTLRAGRPIRVGNDPRALAITPDGATVYVANSGSGTVTPISTRAGTAGRPVRVGRYPRAIAVSPDGAVAYVLDWGSGQVTPISTADNRPGPPVRVGSYPFALAFTPDSSTAYVASYGADTLTPITVATGSAGAPIKVGAAPDAVAVSPDGKVVYVVSGDTESVTPISVGSGRAGPAIRVGYAPADVAFSRSGATAYVVNTISGTVSRIDVAAGRRIAPVSVGLYGYPTVIGIDAAGSMAVVLNTYAGRACLIGIGSGKVVAKLAVGGSPTAVAFTG
jgi:YVTN family beta-propeller protein